MLPNWRPPARSADRTVGRLKSPPAITTLPISIRALAPPPRRRAPCGRGRRRPRHLREVQRAIGCTRIRHTVKQETSSSVTASRGRVATLRPPSEGLDPASSSWFTPSTSPKFSSRTALKREVGRQRRRDGGLQVRGQRALREARVGAAPGRG